MRCLKPVAVSLFVLAMANFAVFWVVAACLGGDAMNGKAENGHYYLMTGNKYTEVSHRVWTYSVIHTISLFITHPLGIGAMALFALQEKRRR